MQMIEIFYTDNILIAYASLNIITKYTKLLDTEYDKKSSLAITKGKLYEYLEIIMNFNLDEDYTIIHYDFIKKLNLSLPNNPKGRYKSIPVPDFLFKID